MCILTSHRRPPGMERVIVVHTDPVPAIPVPKIPMREIHLLEIPWLETQRRVATDGRLAQLLLESSFVVRLCWLAWALLALSAVAGCGRSDVPAADEEAADGLSAAEAAGSGQLR